MRGVIPAARGVGELAAIDALPEVVVVGFTAVTQLADPWMLFALLTGTYWFASERVTPHPRRAGATAIATVAAGYAAVALTKAVAAAPRPPGAAGPVVAPAWLPALLADWYRSQAVADGFGFPSGHAAGAVVAYGALAVWYTDAWTKRRRYAAGAVIAIGVAASRVVLGVHYLVDVIAGGALGVVVLAVSVRLAGGSGRRETGETGVQAVRNPTAVFVLAAALSTVAAGVAGANGHGDAVVEAGIGIGTGVGGAVGWAVVTGTEPAVSKRVGVPAAVITGAVWVSAYAFAGGVAGAAIGTAVAVIGVMVTPAVSKRVKKEVPADEPAQNVSR